MPSTYVRFEYGQEDRMGPDLGPFGYVQLTYEDLRVPDTSAPGGDRTLAQLLNGLWVEPNGTVWSDVVIYAQ